MMPPLPLTTDERATIQARIREAPGSEQYQYTGLLCRYEATVAALEVEHAQLRAALELARGDQ